MTTDHASFLRTIEIEEALNYLGRAGMEALCAIAGTDPTSRKRYSAAIGMEWSAVTQDGGVQELADLNLIESDVDGRYPVRLNARGLAVMADWSAFQ